MKNQYNLPRASESASTNSPDAGQRARGQRQVGTVVANSRPTVGQTGHTTNLKSSLTCLHNLLATRLLTGAPPPPPAAPQTAHEPIQRVGRETRAELVAATHSKKRQQHRHQVGKRLGPVAAIGGGDESRAAELLEMTKCYEEIDQIYDYIRGLSPLPTNLKKIKCIDFEQINESERRRRLVDVQRRQRHLIELQKLRQTTTRLAVSNSERDHHRNRPAESPGAKSSLRSAGPIRVTAIACETRAPAVERVESLNMGRLSGGPNSSSSVNKSKSPNKPERGTKPEAGSELSSLWSASSWARDEEFEIAGDTADKRASPQAELGAERTSWARRHSAGTKSHSDIDDDDNDDGSRASSTSGHEVDDNGEPAPSGSRLAAQSAHSTRKPLAANLSSSPSSSRPATLLSAESVAKPREQLIRLIDEDEDAAEHIYEQIPARVLRAQVDSRGASVGTGGQCMSTSAPTKPALQRPIKQNLPFDYLSRPISTLLRAAPAPAPPPVPGTNIFREQPAPLSISQHWRHLSMSNLHLLRPASQCHYQVAQQRKPHQICQFSSPRLPSGGEQYRVAQLVPARPSGPLPASLGLRRAVAAGAGDLQTQCKSVNSKRFVWHNDRQPGIGANRRRRLTAIGIELADLNQLRAAGSQFVASKQAINQDEELKSVSPPAGCQRRFVSRYLNSLSSDLHSFCSSEASEPEAKSSSCSSLLAPKDNQATCESRPTEERTAFGVPFAATQPRPRLKSDCSATGDIQGATSKTVKKSTLAKSNDTIRQEQTNLESFKSVASSRRKFGSRLLAGLSLIGLDTIGDAKPLASKSTAPRVPQEAACKLDKAQANGVTTNEQPRCSPKLLVSRQGLERKQQPNELAAPPRGKPWLAARRTSSSCNAAGSSGGTSIEIPRLSKRSHLLNRPLPQPPNGSSSTSGTDRRSQQKQARHLRPNRTLGEPWPGATGAAKSSLAAGDRRQAPIVDLKQILNTTTSKLAQSRPIVATQISPTCTSSGISSRLAGATRSRRAADYQVAKLDSSLRLSQRLHSEIVSRAPKRENGGDLADQLRDYNDKKPGNQNMTNLKQFDEKFATNGADQPLVSSNDSLFESINQFSKRSNVKTRAPGT